MKNDYILTTKELADYLKLNEKTIIKMAQAGNIPGVKIGNQWRFHLSSINDYLMTGSVKSAGGASAEAEGAAEESADENIVDAEFTEVEDEDEGKGKKGKKSKSA